MERMLKLPLPSIIRYCKEFERDGILKSTKMGNVIFYSANRANENFLLEKKLFNVKQIYRSGLVKFLKEELHNPTLIVFGSYARGEDIESSDIDLYIETPSKKRVDVKRFENFLRRRLQIFKYKNIREVSNPHLANNIINGIVLNGFLEVFNERGVME